MSKFLDTFAVKGNPWIIMVIINREPHSYIRDPGRQRPWFTYNRLVAEDMVAQYTLREKERGGPRSFAAVLAVDAMTAFEKHFKIKRTDIDKAFYHTLVNDELLLHKLEEDERGSVSESDTHPSNPLI
jgi:hypothetical protein